MESNTHLLIIRDAPWETYEALPTEERLRGMRRWNGWVDGMLAGGKLQLGHPLEDTGRVVAAPKGQRGGRALDGPFAEAREMVGGILLLTDCSLEEATSLARECPFLEYGMTIEVRPVAAACHLARSLGWETMSEPEAAA